MYRILFLCTGNSCRSQMAEGWARRLLGEGVEVFSAGTEPLPLDPLAVEVMAEAGVDISGQGPRHVRELAGRNFDVVVTVCDSAREACPVFPGPGLRIHRPFDDPPALSRGADTMEALAHYRRVRDEIRDFVASLDPGLRIRNPKS